MQQRRLQTNDNGNVWQQSKWDDVHERDQWKPCGRALPRMVKNIPFLLSSAERANSSEFFQKSHLPACPMNVSGSWIKKPFFSLAYSLDQKKQVAQIEICHRLFHLIRKLFQKALRV